MKVALITGGWSREREIALLGGKNVLEALQKEKYDVLVIDPSENMQVLFEKRREIKAAFVLMHGKYGEDGCIQGMLEVLGIPYVGSGVMASAMAVNKKIAKAVYKNEGFKVAPDVIIEKEEDFSVNEIIKRLGEKTVVKPIGEGSSMGMAVCENAEELYMGIKDAFSYGSEIMVEAFINGTEATCCILGNRALPVIQIVPNAAYKFFDYEAKYKNGAAKEICPAPLDALLSDRIQKVALRAHKALSCEDWSRTDMIIRKEEIFILETNTIPGMTQNSLFPLAAKTAGMSFSDLVKKLIDLCLKKVKIYQIL